jgi:activin receptor type-2B
VKGNKTTILLYTLLPIGILAGVVVVSFYSYRRKVTHHPLSADDSAGNLLPVNGALTPSDPNDLSQNLFTNFDKFANDAQIVNIIARGRFGTVIKAKLGGHIVAVKIFPSNDKESYLTECSFYRLPQIQTSENILHFMGNLQRESSMGTEYWVLTEYHENGSLYDFLKSHLIDWKQLTRMAIAIAKGLTFLHEDRPATKLMGHKPSIAHRDFKSKNVLVKSDLSVCIADFGLGLVFEPGKCVGDVHGQVREIPLLVAGFFSPFRLLVDFLSSEIALKQANL